MQYHYRVREKQLSCYSLVHSSWTGPAQELLWRRVSVYGPDTADQIIASPAVGRYRIEKLSLHGGRGKWVRSKYPCVLIHCGVVTDWQLGASQKITAAQASQLLARSGLVEKLDVRYVSGLDANSFFAATNILPRKLAVSALKDKRVEPTTRARADSVACALARRP